ncbi:MAG: zf-HC2 domain-containing protein [Bacteroidota bacterium]
MNCLNRTEMQEYVDNEMSGAKRRGVSSHFDSCKECNKIHLELLDDIRLIKGAMEAFKIETEHIPPIERYTSAKKTMVFKMPLFMKITAAILLIVISTSVVVTYFQQPEIICENEMMVYSFMNDSDPNEQWHDNQMLLTISNDKNEIVFSFLMDNNE